MLTFRYRGVTTIPVEAETIRPDLLAGQSLDDIRRLPVQHGNASVPLAEFFDASGDPNDEHITMEGDLSRVKWIGAGMTRGKITIQGNVGMHLGSEMEGGEIQVHGHVSDWVGAEMHGGKIHIHGNAGHLVGGAYRGSRLGMRGGIILVDGNAENEIGGTMRRGFIAIGGNAGDFVGVSLIAGTIFVFGQPGIRLGAGMKRGTIALFGAPDAFKPLPTFRYDCTYSPPFLPLYLRNLRDCGFAVPNHPPEFRRYSGDLVTLGKGEVLVPAA